MSPTEAGRIAAGVAKQRAPGTLLVSILAVGAIAMAQATAWPATALALGIGVLLCRWCTGPIWQAGVDWSGTLMLRVGVVLLGFRITAGEIETLGLESSLLIVLTLSLTLVGGVVVARRMGLTAETAIVSAGAVAICGASAALALLAALPRRHSLTNEGGLVIGAITLVGTIGMIIGPLIVESLGLSPAMAGIALGATLHEVAHVVGAAAFLPHDVVALAVLAKLLRVACLAPVILAVAWLFQSRQERSAHRFPLPWFVVGFVVTALMSSFGWAPPSFHGAANQAIIFLFPGALVAIGLKLRPALLVDAGPRMLAVICVQTFLLLAIFVGFNFAFR